METPIKSGEFRESLKETDWAWIAGFIDGEGYVGIRRGYTENKKRSNGGKNGWFWYQPRLSVANTNKGSLDFIASAFGSASTVQKRRKIGSNLKSVYCYETCNRDVLRRILPKLLSFLKVKVKQAECVYRLVCLPHGSGPKKEKIFQEYDRVITECGQKAVGDILHGR